MKEIKQEQLKKFSKAFASYPQNKVMQNVLAKNDLTSSIRINERKVLTLPQYEIDIKTMPATNQKASGRCWIFAGMNVLREIIAKKLNLDDFELSQNFISFWDRFEKINYKLESVIELVNEDYDDRNLNCILSEGIQDGGQWDMLVNIINKYGIVPKMAMDETYQSSNTRSMNYVIATSIRKFAASAQKLAKEGKMDEVLKLKEKVLSQMYGFMCTCLGEPVEKFDFEYVDKDKKYHLEEGLTPLGFKEKFIGNMLDDYVSIINAPTFDKPFYKTFTVKYVGNVVGAKDIFYLNLPMDEFKELCVKQLKDNEVIWFGSDCGKYNDGTYVWDDQAFDYKGAFGLDITLDKGDMLNYHVSAMNHAMVITGISFRGGKPSKWKIENSWGTERGDKGYYLMTDSWFDNFVFQAVVNKKYLSKKQLKALEEKPIELNPWDPMGTLAD